MIASAATFTIGGTEMCEDDCERQHGVNGRVGGDTGYVMRVGQERLACVPACHE